MTVLLEYIDLFITCVNIMLGTLLLCYIMINPLLSSKLNLNNGRKLTNHMHISLLNVFVLAMLVIRISVYSLYLETNC